MATLQDYLGITALRDAWPKWKANVIAVNNQVIAHVAGTADKHAAQDITYSGSFTSMADVKAALDQAKTEIGTIVVNASVDPEVALARESSVKVKTFATLDARLEESEQDLVTQLADRANLKDFVWNDTTVDNTTIFNALLLTGQRIILKPGTLTIKGRIRLDLTPHNSYMIDGCGESTILNFVGASAGVYDKWGSQDNENYHIKSMKNFVLRGDLTNTGFECASLCLNAENLLFDSFDRGLYFHDGGYGCKFDNCFIKRCKYGIYFGELVTTLDFNKLYCSKNNDQTGAAIYFDSPVENLKIHGIIQSNKANGVWFGTNFGGTVEFDVYFELNGDKTNSILSMRNDATKGRLIYRNSKIPSNQLDTWYSGDFQLGNDVIVDNTLLTAPVTIGRSLSLRDSSIDSSGGVIPDIITKVSGFNQFNTLYGPSGGSGFVFQLPAILKQTDFNLVNKHMIPFSADVYFAVNSYIYYNGNLYQCTIAGIGGATGPSHTSGTAVNGTATLLFVSATGNWVANTVYALGSYVHFYNNNAVYKCTTAGTSGATAPTHLSGIATNGTASFEFVGFKSDWKAPNTPSVSATGSNPPTVTLDTVNSFSGKNSTKIAFSNNIVGSTGSNAVHLRNGRTALMANQDNAYVISFLMKANQLGSVKVSVTGAVATPILGTINVDTNWRKFVFIGSNHAAGTDTGGCYLFCNSNLVGFEVNITGIVIYDNVAKDQALFNEMLEGNFVY